MQREYASFATRMTKEPDRTTQMQSFVDLLWEALHPTGISWIGFYLHEAGEELVLGPRRDKPACSPIGLHGACGRAFRSRRPVVVDDVKELGDHYIACDPRDQSELVIPLFDDSGRCWGVLDVDSHDVGAFDDHDVRGFESLLRLAGLTRDVEN
ncbi:MAG: GAF domain-containing protein [Phycisphaerales bacterium]|nr:GAF domain-containing protein [Phycisphaerales bacterium]